ncbi:MAG: hypothetical protein R6V75_01790 [Bacteroidales bacterium]
MQNEPDYHFNLFKPLNAYGRKIRNLILTMLAVWAVAVFGFQILLKVLEKPTPEPTLELFDTAYTKVLAGQDDPSTVRSLLHSLVLTGGKTSLKPDERRLINSGINVTIRMLIPDSVMMHLSDELASIAAMQEQIVVAKDQAYLDLMSGIKLSRQTIIDESLPFTGFSRGSLEQEILLAGLRSESPQSLRSPELAGLPDLMRLYLVHNRSFLTDFTFLGFPFHYFYTAVFLLILFVGLCLLYNLRLDRRMKLEKIEE